MTRDTESEPRMHAGEYCDKCGLFLDDLEVADGSGLCSPCKREVFDDAE